MAFFWAIMACLYSAAVKLDILTNNMLNPLVDQTKKRYYEHKTLFPHKNKKVKPRNCGKFANYLWKNYKRVIQHEVRCKIVPFIKSNNKPLSTCFLCKEAQILNGDKRSELVTQCVHKP